MRRVFQLVALLIVAAVGFYGVWPAWSGWRIKSALDQKDAGALSRQVDFDSVRASMRPAVVTKVEAMMDAKLAELGPLAATLGPRLRQEFAPKLTDAALSTMVTPENMIKIAAEGGSIKEAVERLTREQLGKMPGLPGGGGGAGGIGQLPGVPKGLGGGLGGLGGVLGGRNTDPVRTVPNDPVPAPAPKPAGDKPTMGLANIKRFALTGPFSFEVGIARDAGAKEPDVTAVIGFQGFDWKLVGLRPKL
jgi:hypothetical protein